MVMVTQVGFPNQPLHFHALPARPLLVSGTAGLVWPASPPASHAVDLPERLKMYKGVFVGFMVFAVAGLDYIGLSASTI